MTIYCIDDIGERFYSSCNAIVLGMTKIMALQMQMTFSPPACKMRQ